MQNKSAEDIVWVNEPDSIRVAFSETSMFRSARSMSVPFVINESTLDIPIMRGLPK